MRFRSLCPILACAALTAALPAADAAAAAKPPATRVVLKAPKGGDVSYAVVQVKVGGAKATKKAAGTPVWTKTVAGVKVSAVSPAWRKLKATTKAYVVVTKVDGAAANVRNLTFVITRRAGAKAKGSGSIAFTAPGTTPAKGSFWVRKVSKKGVADVFHATDAAANAVKNWSKYLTVLRAANAVKAAFHAIDRNGTFRDKKPASRAAASGQARTAAAATPAIGGSKASPLGRKIVTLVFGTLADRDAYQALKRSTLITDFLRNDLNNPKLAAQWGAVANALPLQVPDAYASNAKEEKRFGKVTQPRIAHTSVLINDSHNASEQAAIETPRSAADTLPGRRVDVQVRGTPNSGTVRVYVEDAEGVNRVWAECRSDCSQFWPPGVPPYFEAYEDEGAIFSSWEGCTARVSYRGVRCELASPKVDFPPATTIVATFTRPGAPAPVPSPKPQPPGAPAPSAPPVPSGNVGKLDTAFGTGGFTLTDVAGGTGFGATGLARQSTGKLVQVGTGDVGAIHTKVLRYGADGTPDAGFGTGGVLTLPDTPDGDELDGYAVAVDGQDRIVITGQLIDAGTGDLDLGVVRLTPDGAVDTTFGTGGWVHLLVGTSGNVSPHAVQVAADGTIYVAGTTMITGEPAVALAALDGAGAPIAGFGTNGVVVDRPDGRKFGAESLAVTAAGLVVAGGSVDGPVVVRYTTAGVVDPAFNGGHVQVMAVGGAYAHGGAQSVAEQADGRIVTAGYVEKADNSGNCLFAQRLTAAGAPDGTFGSGGTAVVCEGNFSGAEAVAVDANGIYAAGHSYGASQTRVLLVRLTAAGAIDTTFDGGIFQHSPDGDSSASTLLLADGHPVLGGSSYSPSASRFLIERVVGH